MIQRIVVGVDEGEGSHRALQWAASRAHELDAEVIAVLGISPAGEFMMTIPPLSPDLIKDVRETFERDWCQPLRDAAVRYRSILVEEEPAHALLDVAEREHADMLVLGAQNHHGLKD